MTLVTEALVLFVILRFLDKNHSFTTREIVWAGLLPSAATLPYVWFVFPYFVSDSLWYAFASEVFAYSVESFLIAFLLRTSLKRGIVLSFSANTVSFLLGLWWMK